MTLKNVVITLLCILGFAVVTSAGVGYFIFNKFSHPQQQATDVNVYSLPNGKYEVLSVANKGFASPDKLTNTFVYGVQDTSSGKHWNVQLVCPPEFGWKVGDKLHVTKPGEVRVSSFH